MSKRILNPDYVVAARAMLGNCPYFHTIDMEMVDVEPGHSIFRIAASRKHLNPYDIVHGGVFASVLDAAAFWAIFSEVDEGLALTTAELKVNFLAPARADKSLLAVGDKIKVGRTLGLAEARLTEEESGRLVGFATATCMIMKAPATGPLSKLPVKFLKPKKLE